MSLYKLRNTWDDYFSLKKLFNLDKSIAKLDSNWPVKPLPSHLQDSSTAAQPIKKILVNPKFIKNKKVSLIFTIRN